MASSASSCRSWLLSASFSSTFLFSAENRLRRSLTLTGLLTVLGRLLTLKCGRFFKRFMRCSNVETVVVVVVMIVVVVVIVVMVMV